MYVKYKYNFLYKNLCDLIYLFNYLFEYISYFFIYKTRK